MPNKISEIQKVNNRCFKNSLENTLRSVQNIELIEYFESDDNSDNHYLEAVLNCKGYFATITYKTSQWIDGNISMTIAFNDCDCSFNIYDIFNLFNINDFNAYEFDNCIEEKYISNSVKILIGALINYSKDIYNASTESNVTMLIKNRKFDLRALYHNNYAIDECLDCEFDYATKYSKMTKSQILSKLENKKNLTNYEKRLYKYCKKNNDSKKTKRFDFNTSKKYVYIVSFVFSIIVAVITYYGWRIKLFGWDVNIIHIGGYEYIIPNYICFFVASTIAFFIGTVCSIGRSIIHKITYEKEIVRIKFGGVSVIKRILISMICILISIALPYIENSSCIGFTKNRIIAPSCDDLCANYNSIVVYQPDIVVDGLGQVFESTELTEYIIQYDGKLYYIPQMTTGFYEEKEFTNQLKKHNITVKKVECIEDISQCVK